MRLPPRELIIIALAVALTLLGDSLLYAVLPAIYQKIGLELWMVGVLLSANRFIRFLTNPVAGRVVERFGLRNPFLLAVLMAAVTTVAYGFQAGFVVFLVARFFWGACWSILRLGGILSALGVSSTHDRGYHLGFFSGFTRVGTMAAVLVGSFMVDYFSFSTTVWIFGGLIFLGGLLLLREPLSYSTPPKTEAPPSNTNPQVREPADPRRWIVYGITCLNGMAGSQLVVATLGLWLLDNFGDKIDIFDMVLGAASLSGILLSGRYLIEVLWSPGAGHLADRVSHTRFIICGVIILAAAMFIFSYVDSLFYGVIFSTVIFLTGTAMRVALDALMGDITPVQNRARVMSWYVNWSDLGNALGPFLAFQLVSLIGLEQVYRTAGILLVCLILPLMLMLRSALVKKPLEI